MPDVCTCGVYAAAVCPRCGESRCAEHFYIEVYPEMVPGGFARDRATGFWKARKPNGTVTMTDLDSRYADQWASGGPGCEFCRDASVTNSLGNTRSKVADVLRSGDLSKLKQLAGSVHLLTAEDRRSLVQAIYHANTPTMELVQARVTINRYARGRRVEIGDVAEIRRQPAVWLQRAECALTWTGDVYEDSPLEFRDAGWILVPQRRSPSFRAVDPAAGAASGWGANSPEPPFAEVTMGRHLNLLGANLMTRGNVWGLILESV